jgi:hypothetical protein
LVEELFKQLFASKPTPIVEDKFEASVDSEETAIEENEEEEITTELGKLYIDKELEEPISNNKLKLMTEKA